MFDAVLPGQPAGERAVRRRDAPRGHPPGQRPRRGQPRGAVRRPHRRRRHRRRLGAGLGDVRRTAARPSGPACRSATRSWRSCSSSARWRSCAPGLVDGIQDLGGAGHLVRDLRAGLQRRGRHARRGSTGSRCATHTLSPEEILMSESQERMCAVVDARTNLDAFLAICAQVGRRGRGHRRGQRLRPADHRLARRADRRRAAAHRRARGPGLRAADRAARTGWTRCRPTRRPERWRGPGRAGELREHGAAHWSARRTWRPRAGSPTSTTATCWATPCWPSPRTPA